MLLVRRIANLFRRSRMDREIDLELQSHLALRLEDNLAHGMSRDDASRDARLRFGNPVVIKEWVTGADTALVLDGLWRDLRHGQRQLRKSPGFTASAVVTLALGVGANAVVFSVFNALILRPLNVPQPHSLYLVEHKRHASYFQSYPDYLDYRDGNSTFSGMAIYDSATAAISVGKSSFKSFGYLASGNYFDLLGIQPALGRFFHAGDEHGPKSAPYIVLSYDFWRSRFNSNPLVLGTTVDLNTHPFIVIGVAPRQFHGTEIFFWPDFWVPIVEATQLGNSDGYLTNRTMHNLWILGRLKAGVTPQQASDNLNVLSSRLASEYPTEDDGLNARLVKPGLMGDVWGDPIRNFLTGIMILASLVLLAACANLGSIFAVRTAERSRELAIRLAIGSSRWKILRALLTEAVLISLLGGMTGTFFAATLLHLLSRWQPFAEFPVHVTVLPDAKVYALSWLLSLGSGIFFGLLPAQQVWRSDAAQAMKSGAGSSAVARGFALRDVLLCVQIALCTLLVTSSLVALRGMERSLHARLGFRPQSVMLAETQLSMGGYAEDQWPPVQRRMAEEAALIPGISAAGVTDRAMLDNDCCGTMEVFRAGTSDFRKDVFEAHFFSISPGYLKAAGTRLLSGRDFTWHDDDNAPEVALVNATFARMMFGNARAVGQQFLLFRGTRPTEVVGVVEDGKYQTLTEDAAPAMFFSLAQRATGNDTVLVVRSLAPANDTADALRNMLSGIDPNLPFVLRSWPDALDLAFFPARAASSALGIMGVLAAMLAVTGIFGMALYSVSHRMKELGIRVALGARRAELMQAALGRPLALLLVGSTLGMTLGMFATQLLGRVVYEANPRDPLVLLGVVATMALLGLTATWIPARRALEIDPSRLMREE